MTTYRVHFANGHTETVEAETGTQAKQFAREAAKIGKDSRSPHKTVSLITRVEPLADDGYERRR